MEFFALDSEPFSISKFQPVKLVENYESLIWSERYLTAGDFELVSSDVSETIALLPLESYVGIRESTVPMIVESHKINKTKGRPATITVKGRSFESVLERRVSVGNFVADEPRAPWTVYADIYKQSDVAYKVMRRVLGDRTRFRTTFIAGVPVEGEMVLTSIAPTVIDDAIDEINLPLPADYSTGETTPYEIKAGNLYSTVLELLEVNHHGIRAVKPPPSIGKYDVDIEIYNGADLRETVVLDARFDQFDDTNYLFSYQGSANIAYTYGPNGASLTQKNTGPAPNGIRRRVLLLDEMTDDALNSDDVRKTRGLTELYKNNSTALFEGEVSFQVGERYNKPIEQGGYGLGDIIKLKGEYGLDRDVRVVEFIRTSDSTGESAYPAFQVIDDEE